MHDQLLGYLLKALEPAEHAEVEERLGTDAVLRQDLERLRRSLDPLAAADAPIEPPLGLAQRTCEVVLLRGRLRAIQPAAPWGGALGSPRSQWGLQELIVAASIVAVAALLFFPAVSRSRSNAQAAMCRDNMRHVWLALDAYSIHNNGLLPLVPPYGKLAMPGIYAPILVEAGYIDDERKFLCPGSALATDPRFYMPTLAELQSAGRCKLNRTRRFVGGSYAYTLGHMSQGVYVGTRNHHRATFALLADCPSLHLPGRLSVNHGGHGQNVLYEDGHVAYVTSCRTLDCGDELFRNDDLRIAPGLDRDDTVIVPNVLDPSCWSLDVDEAQGPLF
jgi:hypothetical protein